MFKVVANRPITETTTINERTFDQCCQERGYDPKDRSKLIQALMQRTSQGVGISLYSLQTFRRKYDQKNQG